MASQNTVSIRYIPHSSLVLGLQQSMYGGTFLSTKFIHIAKTQIPLHAMLNRNNIIENGFKHYEILILLEYLHTNECIGCARTVIAKQQCSVTTDNSYR